MVWQVLVCVLAAAGMLFLAWCVVGALLMPVGGPGMTVIYCARGDAEDLEQAVRSFAWLRGSGVADLPLQVVDCGMAPAARERAERLARAHPFVRVLTAERWEEEFARGTGAAPRQRGSRGVSE